MNKKASARTLVAVGLLHAFVFGCSPSKNAYVEPPPPEVTVAKPLSEPVRLYLEKTGEMESVEQAEVRARVRGFIEKIEFEPGQNVKQGELLYLIEKEEYQAAREAADASFAASQASVAVAEGKVETVKAELSRSERELTRQESLKAQNATSIAEYDEALAAKESAEAGLVSANAGVVAAQAKQKQAKAALDKADLDLNYTEVKAPISGRITKTDVKLGNLIENGGALATIVNADQVFANFTISDREVLRLQKAELEHAKVDEPNVEQRDWHKIKVFVKREIDDRYAFQGRVDYVDRKGIDVKTGTLGIRALFENESNLLLPGLFVNIRIPYRRDGDAILVPQQAIFKSNRGNYVLTVNAEQKVERRDVVLGDAIDAWVIIEEGLTGDDRIVVQGLQRAIPGNEVKPSDIELKSDSRFIGAVEEDEGMPSIKAAVEGDTAATEPAAGDGDTAATGDEADANTETGNDADNGAAL